MKTSSLTITKIEAKNLLKFIDFQVEPGKFTKFRGANDQGKTTALRLAEIAMEGTTNPFVIHTGADKAEVSVEFSNDWKLRRSFTDKNQYVKLSDEQGRLIPSPQKFLDKLLGELQFNPIAWLAMPAKEQIRVLLQAIHITLSPAEIEAAIGFEAPLTVDYSRHGLEVLSEVREHFAAERKAENARVERLRRELDSQPAEVAVVAPVTDEEREEANRKVADAQSKRASIEARRLAATEHDKAVQRLRDQAAREDDEFFRLKADIERLQSEIVRLTDQQQKALARKEKVESEIANLAQSAPPTADEIRQVNETIQQAKAAMTNIQEREKFALAQAQRAKLIEEIDSAKVSVSVIDQAVKVLSNEMPKKLMAKAALPVDSLTIEGDRILIDGQDLQYQATSKQIQISLAIARALNPKLRVICIDGFEALDADRQAAFIASASGDGYQYLISEVDPAGGPLQVEITEEEEVTV